MGEIININSYRSNVKPVNTVGAYSGFAGRSLNAKIRYDSDKIIKANYAKEVREALLKQADMKSGIIVLPENSAGEEDFTEFLFLLDNELYPYIASGRFLDGGFFTDNGNLYGSESLTAEFIGLDFDELVVLSGRLIHTLGVPEVLIKDGKENRVFVIEKT
jgi:hypothetical protein